MNAYVPVDRYDWVGLIQTLILKDDSVDMVHSAVVMTNAYHVPLTCLKWDKLSTQAIQFVHWHRQDGARPDWLPEEFLAGVKK